MTRTYPIGTLTVIVRPSRQRDHDHRQGFFVGSVYQADGTLYWQDLIGPDGPPRPRRYSGMSWRTAATRIALQAARDCMKK